MLQKIKTLLSYLTHPLGLAWVGLLCIVVGCVIGLIRLSALYPTQEGRSYALVFHEEPIETNLEEQVSSEEQISSDTEHNTKKSEENAPHEAPLKDIPSPITADEPPKQSVSPPEAMPVSEQTGVDPVPSVVSEEDQAWSDLDTLQAPLDKTLLEKTQWGFLPTMGAAQHMCWQVYSRPVAQDSRPKISIVIQVLGPDPRVLLTHLAELQPEISVSFLPYTPQLNEVIDRVRSHGHEVLLSVPMEPMNPDQQDSGPYTLRTGVSPVKNRENLYWSLGRGVGYVGVTPYLGHRFVSSRPDLKPMMEEIKARGLLFFDPKSVVTSVADMVASELRVPYAMNHLALDSDLIPEKMDEAFLLLETLAQKGGYAVGTIFSYPLSLEKLVAWARTLKDKGYQIVPISYVASLGSMRE